MASKAAKLSGMMGALPTREETVAKSTAALQSIVDGSKADYRYIRLDNIKLNPANDYAQDDSEQEIKELAADIKRNGLLHNIVVSLKDDGSYLLLSGERRLKAYTLLRKEEPEQAKWQEIYALVRKGLESLEEDIILDAANLQARGSGAKSEARYRKATARFVENLRSYFEISEAEAILLTKQYAGASDSTISRNVSIEKNLVPELKALMDDGHIKKTVASSFAALTSQEQEEIAATYKKLIDEYEAAALEEYGKNALAAIKSNKPLAQVKPSGPKKTVSAVERQKQGIVRSCEKIDKLIIELCKKSEMIKRLDNEAREKDEQSLKERVFELSAELEKLKDALK